MRKRREAGSPLKVIVMSATLSTGLFSEYFGCTVLSASGRTHPVTQVSVRPLRCHSCHGSGGAAVLNDRPLQGQQQVVCRSSCLPGTTGRTAFKSYVLSYVYHSRAVNIWHRMRL